MLFRRRGSGIMAVSALALVAGTLGLTTSSPGVSAADAEVPISSCHSDDNGDPDLTDLDLTPQAVNVRHGQKRVRVTVHADDTGGPGVPSGIAGVFVSAGPVDGFGSHVELAEESPGVWTGWLIVHRWSANGTWQLRLSVNDEVGNYLQLDAAALADAGYPSTLNVDSRPDTTAPRLIGFTLNPTKVDATNHARRVIVTAHLVDHQSGVAPPINVNVTGSPGGRLRIVPGTQSRYRGALAVSGFQGDHVARVSVSVGDAAYNNQYFTPRDLAQLGFPNSFRVIGREDRKPPRATEFSLSPAPVVDVRAGTQTLTATVEVSAAGAPAESVLVSFGQRGRYINKYLRLASGDGNEGTWTGRIPIRPCQANAGRWNVWLSVNDETGNNKYSWRDLKELRWPYYLSMLARDRLSPRFGRYVDNAPLNGPITIKANEQVKGVSAETMPVQKLDQNFVPVGPALPGQWTCQTLGGDNTDCLTGTVRTANFTPDAPLDPSSVYVVMLNPEHVLGLTDLAGNPATPRTLIQVRTVD